MTLTLEFFAEALSGQRLDEAHPVGGVAIDSRQAAGMVFAALPGEKADGHEFVASAFEHGALAALVEREVEAPYPVVDLRGAASGALTWPPPPLMLRVENVLLALQEVARQWCRRWLTASPNHRIIGVTGSVGKTTTKELIADVLATRYRTLKSEKSYNNEIGIPVTVLQLREEHQRAVLEMSMYTTGEIRLLTTIAPPQVGVVTLIAPVHLERAGSMEAIVNAKAELVEALPADGVAILNMDDERVMSLAQRTAARVMTYGLNPAADIWAEDIESLGLEGIRFWMHYSGQRYRIRLPILGRHSVHTALRAAAVGFVEGLTWGEVVSGLQSTHSQLRLIAIKGPHGSVILDDTYNASPPSTIAALNLLNDLLEGRRIAVLGDMLELGAYEERGHRDVGIRASAVADLLVTVGERGRIIAEEALRCRMPAECVHTFATPEEAAAFLLTQIEPGDVILVKGSRAVGMERVVNLLTQAAEE